MYPCFHTSFLRRDLAVEDEWARVGSPEFNARAGRGRQLSTKRAAVAAPPKEAYRSNGLSPHPHTHYLVGTTHAREQLTVFSIFLQPDLEPRFFCDVMHSCFRFFSFSENFHAVRFQVLMERWK
jgi:hypothetical protein